MKGSADALTAHPAGASTPLRRWGGVLLEAVAVTLVGLLLALAANRVSPRGLVLSRDYFPPAVAHRLPQATDTAAANLIAPVAAADPVFARLAARGLQPVDFVGTRELFEDPRHAQELVVFVDARNDAAFAAGHIPGAYPFDRYYPERYFPTVLPVCDTAEVVVVYCTGGDCEDSEFAARALIEAGVAAERLRVFVAGIEEWRRRGMPIELGPRGSGELRHATP
jgi:rhodanese-related sulfurtransferase